MVIQALLDRKAFDVLKTTWLMRLPDDNQWPALRASHIGGKTHSYPLLALLATRVPFECRAELRKIEQFRLH